MRDTLKRLEKIEAEIGAGQVMTAACSTRRFNTSISRQMAIWFASTIYPAPGMTVPQSSIFM